MGCVGPLHPLVLFPPPYVNAIAHAHSVEWGLDRIDQRTGLDGQYDYGDAAGEGTYIYIMDTGIRVSHTDFEGRAIGLWSAGCSGDTCLDGYMPNGVVTGTGCDHPHGTHCASIAAGFAYGVAKKATVASVQVLKCSDGSGSVSGVLRGLEEIATHQQQHGQPSIVSMSIGGVRGVHVRVRVFPPRVGECMHDNHHRRRVQRCVERGRSNGPRKGAQRCGRRRKREPRRVPGFSIQRPRGHLGWVHDEIR